MVLNVFDLLKNKKNPCILKLYQDENFYLERSENHGL